MDSGLPLDKMTASEKLHIMEEVWQDLCRNPEDVPAPPWHGDVLRDREQRIKEGGNGVIDWAEAKRNIRDSIE